MSVANSDMRGDSIKKRREWLSMTMHIISFTCINKICIIYISTTKLIYVTGFWKTDQLVTLGPFHFIGPANGYTHTLHIHSAITRLGGLVCFSRSSKFCQPCKFMTGTMGLIEGATWKAWVCNSPQWWGDVSYAIQACLVYDWHFSDP